MPSNIHPRDLIDRWQRLHQDTKIMVLYSALKALLGFLAVIVASEYVSEAFTVGVTGSFMIYCLEAASIFILGSIALREGARALMVLEPLMEAAED